MNQTGCAQYLRPHSERCHPDHTAEAGSGSPGIAADAVLFPPVIVSGRNHIGGDSCLTSASAFHLLLSSSERDRHCSPIILEISGLAKPGL
jgi:hypothetical protein